jgi:hypothetical protein
MNNDSNLKNDRPKKAGEVNHELLPNTTTDEIDLDIDPNRDDEIARDKPPHH